MVYKSGNGWMVHFAGEKGLYRSWLHFLRAKLSLEICWRKKVSPGFKLHFGNEGSETPVDVMFSIYWLAFFWSADWPGLGEFCAWFGRGHKRNLSLKFHDNKMWWELWYDDDMGHDNWHQCDLRRTPVYPWRWGRAKYRSWMCLRQGNLDLNPLDAFWGFRGYHYEDLEDAAANLHVNQFPHDSYLVRFTLQKRTRFRAHGPWWARRVSDEGYVANWGADPYGIPYRNNSWKGDEIMGSSERIHDEEGWVDQALYSLKNRIISDRRKYNYHPALSEE